MAVKNAYGRVKYGYNQKNLVTSYKDGEGNESHKLYDRLDNLIVYYPPKESKLSHHWKNIIVLIEMEKGIFRKRFIPMRIKEGHKKKLG